MSARGQFRPIPRARTTSVVPPIASPKRTRLYVAEVPGTEVAGAYGANSPSSGLTLSQHRRVEAFGEPIIDRREKVASLIPLTLIAREPGEIGSSAKL